MSAWLIALVGMIYVAVAIDLALKGAGAMSLLYVGYALANVGAYWMAKAVTP